VDRKESESRELVPPGPGLDGESAARFEEYVSAFRCAFQRADQFLRFRAYLRGLLEPSPRKNVEAISAAASRVIMVESNLSQALQHFVSHSPWDARRLFAMVRKHAAPLRADGEAVWVIHDGVFAKKGRHSVGVQRQFARSVGKKINCQVGVFVSQVGPAGYYPLAARLYLPASWLRENEAEKGIPAEERQPASKAEIALRLFDELRAEGGALPIIGEPGYLGDPAFREGLAARGFAPREDLNESLAEALNRFEWLKSELGLDHFEGRTWHGWHHHVSLVFAAYGFLSQGAAVDSPPFRSPAQ
jgi:SRSO17 transposase